MTSRLKNVFPLRSLIFSSHHKGLLSFDCPRRGSFPALIRACSFKWNVSGMNARMSGLGFFATIMHRLRRDRSRRRSATLGHLRRIVALLRIHRPCIKSAEGFSEDHDDARRSVRPLRARQPQPLLGLLEQQQSGRACDAAHFGDRDVGMSTAEFLVLTNGNRKFNGRDIPAQFNITSGGSRC